MRSAQCAEAVKLHLAYMTLAFCGHDAFCAFGMLV